MSKQKNKLLIFGLERNPFNDIQFDALCEQDFVVDVIYTVNQKSTENNTCWAEFPDRKYTWDYLTGFKRVMIFSKILFNRDSTVIFTGYSSIYFVMAMIICLILNMRYLVFTDTPVTRKRVGVIKGIFKSLAIQLSFRSSSGVLTTGRPGREALLRLG